MNEFCIVNVIGRLSSDLNEIWNLALGCWNGTKVSKNVNVLLEIENLRLGFEIKICKV